MRLSRCSCPAASACPSCSPSRSWWPRYVHRRGPAWGYYLIKCQTHMPHCSLHLLQGTADAFGGEFVVPSYRGSSFLDPKGRGASTGCEHFHLFAALV